MNEQFKFDKVISRAGTGSIKWERYGESVLPLWVADMDFESPPAVIEALHERVTHGIFGYTIPTAEIIRVVVKRMMDLYQWEVDPEALVFIPGVVSGLNMFTRMLHAGDGMIVQTPVYPPILSAPGAAGLIRMDSPLVKLDSGNYEIDFANLESRMKDGASGMILCNPHNPVGRVYNQAELSRIASLCEQFDILLCSDEIHCDLIMPGHAHTPIASISKSIANRTITYIAPSKTYNIAGLGCAIAIIPDQELRKRFNSVNAGIVPHVNALGYTAALAAYQHGGEWLEELIQYLKANRDYLGEYFSREVPELKVYPAEGTYLAWIDCSALKLDVPAQEFFLKECKVALNLGCEFGEGYDAFVRLNFGCPRSILEEALSKMVAGIRRLKG